MDAKGPDFYRQVYAVVRRIPRGRVTSYGRVARMLGRPNAARAVGYALAALAGKANTNPPIPWHRVINHAGRISTPDTDGGASMQRKLLQVEGVVVGDDLRVDLGVYLWEGLHLVDIDDIIAGRG
jgi:methylated-DNA-protein-cysteine methyltransferase-like protein